MQSDNSSENKSFEVIELLPIEELFSGIQSPFDNDISSVSSTPGPTSSKPEGDHNKVISSGHTLNRNEISKPDQNFNAVSKSDQNFNAVSKSDQNRNAVSKPDQNFNAVSSPDQNRNEVRDPDRNIDHNRTGKSWYYRHKDTITQDTDIRNTGISGSADYTTAVNQDTDISGMVEPVADNREIDKFGTADQVTAYSDVAEDMDISGGFYNTVNTPPTTSSDSHVNPDFNRFFRDDWQREQQEADRKKKNQSLFVLVCVFIVIVLIARVVVSRFVSFSKDENGISVDYYPDDGYNKSMIPLDTNMSANSAFQIVSMKNIEYEASYQYVSINPMVIIYNGQDSRVLLFRIKPEADNVVPRIYVTAYDNDGNILAENTQSMTGVGEGSEGMLPISLKIGSDETDVRYYVRCNCGIIVTPDSQRRISGVREEDNHLLVSLYGKNNMYKDVYAVFYKDGKLVELMTARSKSAYGLKDYTTVDVDFDLGQIDWDTYQLYL